ncbi:MAG: GTP cyclohydrolase I FolE [Candidatus Poribacteria bacterium]|nr:GTP cyclohydrolase I FolE [Candidatus Poribacteria bacterium]
MRSGIQNTSVWTERDDFASPDAQQAERLAELYGALISGIGEDSTRQGLLKTPMRAAKAMQHMTQGYHQKLDEVINGAVFEEATDGIVIVRDIEFYSLCEHHLLPFYGKCHAAYLPNDKIIGLSKIPRLVDMFARRFQVQERMTREIAEAIEEAIQPRGVAVVTEAAHMCMMVRGVEKQHSSTVTSYMLGAFREDPATRKEFFDLVQSNRFNIR